MKVKKIKNKSGFSLVEMLVALSISSLIVLSATAAFSSMFQARNNARKVQINLEMTRTALDQMAKNMRMSSGLVTGDGSPSDDEVYMYNNSQSKCIWYRFFGSALEISELDMATPPTDFDCTGEPFGAPVAITKGTLTNGQFFVTETDRTVGSAVIGKATVSLTVDNERVQTSVSFRDYQEIIQDI